VMVQALDAYADAHAERNDMRFRDRVTGAEGGRNA
jgi:hypothetical protein